MYREIAPIVPHLQGEPPDQILRTSNTHRIAAQADSSAAPTYRGHNCFMLDPGLPRADEPISDSLSPLHSPAVRRGKNAIVRRARPTELALAAGTRVRRRKMAHASD